MNNVCKKKQPNLTCKQYFPSYNNTLQCFIYWLLPRKKSINCRLTILFTLSRRTIILYPSNAACRSAIHWPIYNGRHPYKVNCKRNRVNKSYMLAIYVQFHTEKHMDKTDATSVNYITYTPVDSTLVEMVYKYVLSTTF